MKKSLETNEPLQCFNTNNVNFTLITKKKHLGRILTPMANELLIATGVVVVLRSCVL